LAGGTVWLGRGCSLVGRGIRSAWEGVPSGWQGVRSAWEGYRLVGREYSLVGKGGLCWEGYRWLAGGTVWLTGGTVCLGRGCRWLGRGALSTRAAGIRQGHCTAAGACVLGTGGGKGRGGEGNGTGEGGGKVEGEGGEGRAEGRAMGWGRGGGRRVEGWGEGRGRRQNWNRRWLRPAAAAGVLFAAGLPELCRLGDSWRTVTAGEAGAATAAFDTDPAASPLAAAFTSGDGVFVSPATATGPAEAGCTLALSSAFGGASNLGGAPCPPCPRPFCTPGSGPAKGGCFLESTAGEAVCSVAFSGFLGRSGVLRISRGPGQSQQ